MNKLYGNEEKFGKVVGRRKFSKNALSMEGQTIADSVAWREAFGGIKVPRGVYKFKTHEEADEWLWKMMTRPKS